MLFNKPSLPPESIPKVTKPSLWNRIVNYVANDQDYVAPLKITKAPEKKKPRNIWKSIKAGATIFITFYVLLCAFVLLNPQYALFFNNVLGVQYLTIRTILEYTIYVVYSIFGIILGAGFLYFGFRAIVIKTKIRSKRINVWLITIFFCLLFFSNIALFAWTYDWFRRIDFGNLDGRVIIYDNTILKYLKPEEQSQAIIDADAKIGPVSVRYDISAYIKKIARIEGLLLTQPYTFEIDYNADKRFDRGSGQSNFIDRPISDIDYSPVIAPEFAYDTIGNYKPEATIRGIDVGGKPITLTLELPTLSIEKIVKIGRTNLTNGGIQYTFDASELSDLGQVRWTVLGKSGITKDGYQFSPDQIFQSPTLICLQVFRGNAPISDRCDWKFVTEETTKSNIQNTDITIKLDPINPLKYQFSVDPKAIQGDIKTVRWFIDNNLYVGKFDSGFERIFDYTFHKPGTYKIEAEIEDTLGNIVRVGPPEPVYTAEMVDLKDGYTLQITDEEGTDLDKDTYDKTTQSYLLPDFPVPGILTLDATRIRANSPRLRLEKVEWDKDNDGKYETEGLSLEKDIQTPGRYDVRARYTFTDLSVDGKDIPIYHLDRVAVVGIQKPIDVRVKITPDDNYAPANVRFDASGSKILKGDIRKFIYDFGDGKTYEGEGVVTTYRYNNPGEYKIIVTAVTNKGEKSSKTYTLLLKKPQETVQIEPSIASGMGEAELPITFDAAVRGTDNIIRWDMGDGTGEKSGKSIIYKYASPGTYTIRVWVQYTSGIEESDSITYVVR